MKPIQLPTEKSVKSKSPTKLIIYSHPKVGKTELLSLLPNTLIIDSEHGAKFVEALSINLIDESINNGMSPFDVINSIAAQLAEYKNTHGTHLYDYIAIDTLTGMEKIARSLATFLYKRSNIGKNFEGTDVVAELPKGGGYEWLRKAFDMLVRPLEGKYNKAMIFTGHVKDSSINKLGVDISARDLALTGKNQLLFIASVDTTGYLYRNPKNMNQTIISFKVHEQDLMSGARPDHLSNQEFVICELTNPEEVAKGAKKQFVAHWDKIFID